ncbi:MAG: DUF1501 domain-containing protein [Pseudomonadota bacterium]
MTASRRMFLKSLAASVACASPMANRMNVLTAHAAETSGYKALVCVFLFGGMDNHDVLLPFDQGSYDAFAQLRSSFISQQGASRQRQSLLPLSPATTTAAQGRQVALPPEMPNLKSLFDRGDAAIVGNVGPLIEPVTRQTFESGAARIPLRLFSHNDQQATWQASAPEGAQFGWGGLFADAMLNAGANSAQPQFTTIASEEVGPFLTGRSAVPYRVSPGGAARVFLLEDLVGDMQSDRADLAAAVRQQLAARSYRGDHILEQDIASAFDGGLATNDVYDAARQGAVPLATAFSTGPLSDQLRAIAETISVRDQLFASRQIFFAGLGGFDTHSAQATSLPTLLAELDRAIGAFQSAMAEQGLADSVTLFTASDFGRTLAVNGDGTDHGWGGHHFVVGGGVNGGDIYGSVPAPELGHSADSGGGRLIPSMAVEQYAAQLGSWFGLSNTELATALPNLGNFDPVQSRFI